MARVTSTLSAAVAVNDTEVLVASAASISAGRFLIVNDEWMRVTRGYVAASTTVPVIRGQQGSAQRPHPVTSNVTHGDPTDFGDAPAQVSLLTPAQRPTRIRSYSASGAIEHPLAGEDQRVILSGSAAMEMTLAVPDEALDGCLLWIAANTAGDTSFITIAGGLGGGGDDYVLATYPASGQGGIILMAVNGVWVPFVPIGESANIGVTISAEEPPV